MEKGRESDSGRARGGGVGGQVPRLLFKRSAGWRSRLLMPVNYYLSPFLFTTTVGDSKVSLSWQISDPTPARQTCRHHCESVTTEMGGTNIPQQDWEAQPTPRQKNKGRRSLCLFYSIFLATKFSLSRQFIL